MILSPGTKMKRMNAIFRSFFAFFLVTGCLAWSPTSRADGPAKLALLIANEKYDARVGAIQNSSRNAALIEAALKTAGFSVTILKDSDFRMLESGLQRFAYEVRRAGKNAVSFLYYSGHGLAARQSEANYLIPVDVDNTTDESLWRHSFALSKIIEILEQHAPDTTHFVVLDAARSELNRSGASQDAGKGLVPVAGVANILFAYATAPKLSALDKGSDASVFAKTLAEEILKPDIDAATMFRNVQARVKKATGQTPWLSPVSLPAIYFLESSAHRKLLEEKKLAEAVQPAAGKDPRVGESFRDCKYCPEIIVLPSGSFVMGSPDNEPEHTRSEGPQHKVTFAKPFAAGKFTITFAEWDACVANGGCGSHTPDDNGWGRNDMPVINVGWDDAQAYVKWLAKTTGKKYRLLSEAEWEYIARAGTSTPFWWGSGISSDQANYNGTGILYRGGGKYGVSRQKTVPVRTFDPNPWGVYQVHGNVWEWVEDCWNTDYNGAPSDGSARTTGNCGSYVVRGGAWTMGATDLRAANRIWYGAKDRNEDIGFRIARTLD
jgi:formylglycine-generating enzyme required for sulfatase activity